MAYETILYDVADGILTITLNRPDKLNAVTSTTIDELIGAIGRADADDAVRAVIVTGSGRAFCAGADLSRGAETFDVSKRPAPARPGPPRDGGGRATLAMYDCRKPLIAAVNGPAVGFGVTMQLAMDVRLASETARFGFVFTRRGVVMEGCSSWFLPRIVGMQQALEWVLSGRVMSADEALAGGLVRSVHAPADLLPAARALAREIADNTSGLSVALCRQLMWKGLGYDHPMESHRWESRCLQGYMGKSADAREGVTSFLEKRPPRFPMRPSADMPEFYPWWAERRFEP